MKLVSKTLKKVVIEAHVKEVEIDGFEALWDKIRNVYKMEKYEIFSIEKNKDKTLIFIELVPIEKNK